jgi:hypothetical protein
MKPSSHITDSHRRAGGNRPLFGGFPVTDFHYQSLTLDGCGGGCANIRPPSFRNISMDYFKKEARRSFVTEAAFFALMVVTAAWPMVQSIRAIAHLVRVFAGA